MRECTVCEEAFSETEHRCPHCGAIRCPQCGAVTCIACGHMYPHDEVDCPRCNALPAGVILNQRYELESWVGRGGKGRIYKAKMMHQGGKLCALKEMLPPHLSSGEAGTSTRARYERARQQFERARELFKREADVLDKLHHPNIPTVYGSFEQRDRSYLVMDFIEGTSLQKVIDDSENYLPQAQVLEWVLQVCEVLDYLHDQEPQPIVHRDVKPANLILTDQDDEQTIMLVDFGIARTYTGEKSRDTHHIATWNFAAPEQRLKIRLESSPQTDIYAVGATLYYLLTNKGDEDEIFLEVSEKGISGLPHDYICPTLEEIIRKACAWHPRDRFGSVREMQEVLERVGALEEIEDKTRDLKCYRHPSRAADDVCDVCGEAICEECTVLRPGKCLCPDCAIEDTIVPIEAPWWEEEKSLFDRLKEPKILIPLSVVAAVVVCAMLALATVSGYRWIQQKIANNSPPTPIALPTENSSERVIVVVSTSTSVPTSTTIVGPTSESTVVGQGTPVTVAPPTPTPIPTLPTPIIPPFPNKPCFDTRFKRIEDIGGATQEVRGHVYNMNGRPIKGALVEIYVKGRWSQVQKQDFTKDDGGFAFIGYPLGGSTDHEYILRVIRMPDDSPAYNTWEETYTFKFNTSHDRAVVDIWQVSFHPNLCHPPSEVQ